MFGPYSDYLLPLLKILDVLPHRTERGENVIALVGTQYHEEIPDYAYRIAPKSGKMYWVQCVYNIQGKAKELGLIDNPERGIWRLTENGHQWLLDHPDASHFSGGALERSNKVSISSSSKKIGSHFSEKVKNSSDHPKSKLLVREIANIQSYLDGHSSMQPSDEKICDWVYFCYTFELYSEGRDLFALISRNEVNPWYYERTKKLAKLCEIKAMTLQVLF